MNIRSSARASTLRPLGTLHAGLRRGDNEAVDPTLSALLGHPPRTVGEYVHDRF